MNKTGAPSTRIQLRRNHLFSKTRVGNIRGRFSLNERNAPIFALYDENQSVRVGLTSEENATFFLVYNKEGAVQASLSLRHTDVAFQIYDATGYRRVGLGIDDTGPKIDISNEDGIPILRIIAPTDGEAGLYTRTNAEAMKCSSLK